MDSWGAVYELVEDIESAASEVIADAEDRDNYSALEFAESILEKAHSIANTVEEMEEDNIEPTEHQIRALENMLDGLERWL